MLQLYTKLVCKFQVKNIEIGISYLYQNTLKIFLLELCKKKNPNKQKKTIKIFFNKLQKRHCVRIYVDGLLGNHLEMILGTKS